MLAHLILKRILWEKKDIMFPFLLMSKWRLSKVKSFDQLAWVVRMELTHLNLIWWPSPALSTVGSPATVKQSLTWSPCYHWWSVPSISLSKWAPSFRKQSCISQVQGSEAHGPGDQPHTPKTLWIPNHGVIKARRVLRWRESLIVRERSRWERRTHLWLAPDSFLKLKQAGAEMVMAPDISQRPLHFFSSLFDTGPK